MALKVTRYLMLALLVMASGVAYAYSNIARCIFVDYSNFTEIQNNLYVSGHISSNEHTNIRVMIYDAKRRITKYYGKPKANPVVIVTGNKEEAENYGLHDIPGSLFFTPWNSYLVLNHYKAGVDVASHEFVHAEIVDRLGYFTRQRELPTWFDEGAALQVDFRPQYTETTEIKKEELNRVTALDSPDKFWSSDTEQNIKNYQSAKIAVAKFLKEHPSRSLYALLARIIEGEKFEEIIKN
jgi:hypothetical protein